MTTKTHTARDQLFFDIFVTAIEGGISYWSELQTYHLWLNDNADDGEDVTGFEAEVIEENGDEMTLHTINRATISRGYRLAAGEWKDKIRWSTERPPLVVDDDTDWDFDAGDADEIVQLGLGLIDTIRTGPDAGRQVVRYG